MVRLRSHRLPKPRLCYPRSDRVVARTILRNWIADWTAPRICRPYDANEVFVTGTFDDWGKTVRLDRVSDGFAKEVSLPIERVQYKVGFPASLLFELTIPNPPKMIASPGLPVAPH